MLFRSLTMAVVLASTGSLLADAPLVWKFSRGAEIPLEVRQSSESTLHSASGAVVTKTNQTVVLSWKVEEVDASGAATLMQDIRRLQLNFDAPGGQGYQLDTNLDEPPQGLATMIAPLYRALSEHDLRLTLSPQGKVLSSQPPEEVLQLMKNMPGAAVLGNGDDLYQQLLRPALIELPLGEVKVGQQWTSFIGAPLAMFGLEAAEFRYEYRGERELDGRSLAVISVTLSLFPPEDSNASQIEIELTSSDGEVLFDRDAGRVQSGQLTSRFNLKVKQGDQVTAGEVAQTVAAKYLPPGTKDEK